MMFGRKKRGTRDFPLDQEALEAIAGKIFDYLVEVHGEGHVVCPSDFLEAADVVGVNETHRALLNGAPEEVSFDIGRAFSRVGRTTAPKFSPGGEFYGMTLAVE